jgi:hypothetical protein
VLGHPFTRDHLWRWRRWIAALGLLLLVRAALPEIVRRVMISQAAQVLHAHVEIGDVDLALYRGGIALKDVAIRAATPAADDAPPLITWKRLAVEVRWFPLLRRTVRLRQVALESPRVALDRLADGQLNLLALLPAREPPPAEATPTAAPSPATHGHWEYGVDRVVLRDGGLRFRDLAIMDSEPVEINLEHVEVTDIALNQNVYGGPSNLHLAMAFDQGSLDLDGRVTFGADRTAIEANLNAWGLPLRQARLYIPKVGWSALDGTLDAAVNYRSDTGRRNEVSGTVALRDVSVQVPALEEPVLAWRSLTVRVDPIDLLAHRAAVTEIELSGAALLVRPQGGDLLPLFAAVARDDAAADAAPADTDAKAQPWLWSLASLHVADSRVRLIGREAPLDVGVGLTASDLAGDSDHPAHLELALTAGAGTVNVDGQMRVRSPGFAGTVRTADLSVPEIIAATSALPRELLQAGRLQSELTVEAGLSAPGGGPIAAHDVRVHGKVALADARLTTPGAQPFSIGARSIDLDLKDLQLGGALPGTPAGPSAPSGDVHLSGKLSVADPTVATPDGSGISGGARLIQVALVDLVAAGVLSTARLPAAPAGSGDDLQVGASLAVADLHVAAPGPQGFSLDARSIDLGISQLSAQSLFAAAPASPDFRVRSGRLSVEQFNLVGADPKLFLIGARSFELPIKELFLPGGYAPAARAGRMAIGDIRVTGPTVQITRTTDGLLLPQFAPADTSGSPAASPSPAAAPPPQRIEIAADTLRLTDGTLTILDRAVKPFFRGGLAPFDLELRDLRWPALAADKIHVTATGPEQGKIEVFGALKPDEGWIEVYGEDLGLPSFNPYATTFSSYSIGRGALSWVTKGSFKSGRYYADSSLTLHRLSLESGAGESLFQQQFGIPLELALALMRDIYGDIALDIPIEADAQGTNVDVLAVVGNALRHAIVNALASPLKLVGAVFGGDTTKVAAPAPIGFRPGRAELDPSGSQQVDQLAAFLASRPGIAVTLDASVTNTDVRWLREQTLRQEWDNAGVLGALRGLTQRNTRERIRQALEARAKDDPVELSADDAAALDRWLDEQPAIPPEQLRALADQRLTHTEMALEEAHGIDATRVARREPPADFTDGAPAVRVELSSVGR